MSARRDRRSAEQRRGEILAVAIRAHVRASFGAFVAEVTQLAGVAAEDVWRFLSQAMLHDVTAALDLEAIAGESPWAAG